MIKTARSAQSTAKAIEELNVHADGSNASSDTQLSIDEPSKKAARAWSTSQGHSVSEVYSKFISAVSFSLSHALGKRREWIQVGPCACIDARTLRDDIFNKFELYPRIATTLQLSFNVKWFPSGMMLISFFQVQLPRYIRVSQMLSGHGQSAALTLGSPLLLSPSGIRCRYMGTEATRQNDAQRKPVAQIKASVLSRLLHQGIRPTHEVTWIQVQRAESNLSVGPLVSLWPADLCFREDWQVPINGEGGDLSHRSIVDGSADPLEEAESWFLGKAARMEASRARVQEGNQAVQVLKDVEDTDDEDLWSPFDVPLDQGITPQDVSGIYPTPPDGQAPAVLGFTNPNVQPDDYGDREKELQPSDEAHGDNDGQENDDLFGDMDIDMFASNGLTEADFSFFDDPGMIDEELRDTGQTMALDDTIEPSEQSMAFVEQGPTVILHERGDGELDQVSAEDQANATGMQGKRAYCLKAGD